MGLTDKDRVAVTQASVRGSLLARVLLDPLGALSWLPSVPMPNLWADYCIGAIHLAKNAEARAKYIDEVNRRSKKLSRVISGPEPNSDELQAVIRENNRHARAAFERGVAQGSPDAMCSLASMLLNEPGGPKIDEALSLYKRAYEKHAHARAACCLGMMYDRYKMWGCRSRDEACKMYVIARDRGFYPAEELLRLT